MVAHDSRVRPSAGMPLLWGVTVGLGAIIGGLISVVAFWLARYGPSGDAWSFKGNGALIAYGLFPAALAAGWTALVLHRRSHHAWRALGLAAGLVGVLLLAADAALLPLFGSAIDRAVGGVLLYVLAAWTVVAPFLAMSLPAAQRSSRPTVGLHVAAGLAWLAALTLGLVVVGTMIPAGS